ncbi:50S ribosomal protein L10 [Candidatus Karelsulcia muelleri]
MTPKKKKDILYLRDLFNNKSLNFYFINIKGLNSSQQTYLRKKSNKKHIKIKVVVNTLLKQSLKLTKNPKMVDLIPFIKENTTLLWAQVNNGPAELLLNFIKKEKLSIEKIFKLAFSEEILYLGKKSLKYLRKLKSKKDLVTILIKNINQLISKTLIFLNQISKIIFILKMNKAYKNEN